MQGPAYAVGPAGARAAGVLWASRRRRELDTSTLLLILAVAVLVILALLGLLTTREPTTQTDPGLATSTEGMKICPKCGMGNLWTERSCSACGNALKG